MCLVKFPKHQQEKAMERTSQETILLHNGKERRMVVGWKIVRIVVLPTPTGYLVLSTLNNFVWRHGWNKSSRSGFRKIVALIEDHLVSFIRSDDYCDVNSGFHFYMDPPSMRPFRAHKKLYALMKCHVLPEDIVSFGMNPNGHSGFVATKCYIDELPKRVTDDEN